jgi:hypothetical protein
MDGLSERKFRGSEWDVGYTFGREGCSLPGSVSRIGTRLGRSLNEWERREFAAGWRAGELDRLNADGTLTACELLDIPL